MGQTAAHPRSLTSNPISLETVQAPDGGEFDFDVAVVRLSTPVARLQRTGWLGLSSICKANKPYPVSTAGYPTDK